MLRLFLNFSNFLFFSHTLHRDQNFPTRFFFPHPSPLPEIYPLCSQKRAGLPGTSTKHDIICYNNTRHKPLHEDWTRWPSRKKRIPQVDKRVRDTPAPNFRNPIRTPSYLAIIYIYAEDLSQTHPGSLISESLLEFLSVDSVDYGLMVSLAHLFLLAFLSFLCRIPQALPNVFGYGILHLFPSLARWRLSITGSFSILPIPTAVSK